MKFREAEEMILNDRWYLVATKGSHHHYRHPVKSGKVTIPNYGHKDLHLDTIRSIKKQALLSDMK